MLLLTKVGVEGMVELSPEEVVVLGEGDQAELECKVIPRPSDPFINVLT